MLLLRTGLSRFIKRLSFISKWYLLLPCAKILNSSKEGQLLQFKRWSRMELSADGLIFLDVKADIPMCSPALTFKCLFVSP